MQLLSNVALPVLSTADTVTPAARLPHASSVLVTVTMLGMSQSESLLSVFLEVSASGAKWGVVASVQGAFVTPGTVVPLSAGAVDPGLVRVRVRIAQGTGNAVVDAQGTALDPKDAVFRLAHNNILRAVN